MEDPHVTAQFLIIGLPESGKTSFIQALDEILQNPPVPEALRTSGLAHDRSYLEKDKAKFRSGKKLDRTDRNVQGAPPELWFLDPSDNTDGRIFLPDLSGEIYRDQWVEREWSTRFRDDLLKIAGILAFVRADIPASNVELLGELLHVVPKQESTLRPWEPKKSSAQVQLVDVLQFVAGHRRIKKPLPLALLISAWDTIDKPGNNLPRDPSHFLAQEWPLVSQYLESNSETFVSRVYGVSALGGSEEELKELREIPPHERVKLVDKENSSRDLTRPLRWLLQLSRTPASRK
jgi:hypothetical protein